MKGEGGTTKIRAKRDFFLSTDVRRISTDSLTISFSAFKDQSLTETNVIVGFFDDLLYRKHFQTAGTPKIKLENGVAGETILSEKNLSFSYATNFKCEGAGIGERSRLLTQAAAGEAGF